MIKVNTEFNQEYLSTINYIPEFKQVALYLINTENPALTGLEEYLAKSNRDPNFKFYRLLRQFANEKKYNDLVGFFKYFGINEMEQFVHNKTGLILFQYIKENFRTIRVFWDWSSLDHPTTIQLTRGFSKFYYSTGSGSRDILELNFFINRCKLFNVDLLNIKRIEKLDDGTWIPVDLNVVIKNCDSTKF
jgi:hypothetical protein